MITRKIRFSQLFSLALFILVLTGCNSNEKSVINHYYLSLMGESESWSLTGYEVLITSDHFKAGNGTLNMKNANEYIGDSFQFRTYAVINGEDTIVHSGSVAGAEIDIAKQTTGAIEGESYLDKNGDFITLNDVTNIYMTVEWWDEGLRKSVRESIDLYNKESKEQTFLHE
ncbi:hypothetical protein [Lysinibacillus sp. 54212]|uniref:hypothetical protein n=1 Tax=Lysinibacillus sp. 54212 TaxID=3119829 RepID=UPI002FC5F03B